MEHSNVCLMNFPDCLLLNILKYLDSTSLYQLTKVNKRLEMIILDSCLWKKIDARSEPNSVDKIEYCLKRINKSTTTLCLRGRTAAGSLLTKMKLDNFSNNLTILALEDQNINEPIISLNDFPKTLVELSFKNSSISNSSHFFRKTFEKMENLRVLLLDGCSLINSSVVMSVSKYQNLEILSFYKCEIENSIPYFSIAAFHGFKKLKILDVRLSGLGNPFLRAMIRSTNIISFYFQNMDTSYILDYENRQFEMELKGNVTLTPQVDFTVLNTIGNEDTLITDNGTAEFLRTAPKNDMQNLPSSFLFTDPYGPCTCGYIDNIQDHSDEEREENECSNKPTCDSNDKNSSDRYRIIEYPVIPNQKERKSEGSKRKKSDSLIRPLKKRKRTVYDTEEFYCHPSTSSESPAVDRSAICENNSDKSREIHCSFDNNSHNDNHTDESSRHQSRDTNQSNENKRHMTLFERCSMCSISSTETVECLDDRTTSSSRNDDQQRLIPLKKRKHNHVDDKEEVDKDKELSMDPLAGCSRNGALNRNQSDNDDGGADDDNGGADDDDKPEDSRKCSIVRNICCAVDILSNSKNTDSPTSSSNSTASTSRPTECSLCGRSLDSDTKTSKTPEGSSGDSDDSSNETNEDQSQPRTPPPLNSPIQYYENQQNHLGVVSINRIDANNRNLLQICIRRNRERSERRGRFNPDAMHMRRDVNYPVVLNFVRMINFMLQPDQQPNNDPRNNPEFEILDGNFIANREFKLALKRLSFRGYTKVTDATLRSVEQLNLELLDVTYTKVTKGGIRAFLRVNPNCRVLHKEFCVCRPRFHF